MTDQPDFEELEQIPWAALATKPADPRARYAVIIVVALVVIGAVVALSMREAGPMAIPATGEQVSAPAAATVSPIPETASSIPAAPTTAAPTVYSEADLMLIDVEEESRIAVMHAEWLVRDLLTVDGDAVVTARIADLLPDVVRSDTTSYVEWVEAFAVHSPEPGQYRVEVVYRVLVGGEEGFVREPAAAMAVALAVDTDGSARLLTAPETILVPVLDGVAPG